MRVLWGIARHIPSHRRPARLWTACWVRRTAPPGPCLLGCGTSSALSRRLCEEAPSGFPASRAPGHAAERRRAASSGGAGQPRFQAKGNTALDSRPPLGRAAGPAEFRGRLPPKPRLLEPPFPAEEQRKVEGARKRVTHWHTATAASQLCYTAEGKWEGSSKPESKSDVSSLSSSLGLRLDK